MINLTWLGLIVAIMSLLFIPTSPMGFISSILFFRKKDKDNIIASIKSNKKRSLLALFITIILGIICVHIAEFVLPYRNIYPKLIWSFFKVNGIAMLYLFLYTLMYQQNKKR